MARIKDESNATDDANLPKRTTRRDIAAERQREDRSGWSVTGRTGAQRDGHPDGFKNNR